MVVYDLPDCESDGKESDEKVTIVVDGHEGEIWGVEAHPNEEIFFLTGGHDRLIKVWEEKTKNLVDVYQFETLDDKVNCLAFNPTGDLLAVGLIDSEIALFTFARESIELISKYQIPCKKGAQDDITDIRFSAEGSLYLFC